MPRGLCCHLEQREYLCDDVISYICKLYCLLRAEFIFLKKNERQGVYICIRHVAILRPDRAKEKSTNLDTLSES